MFYGFLCCSFASRVEMYNIKLPWHSHDALHHTNFFLNNKNLKLLSHLPTITNRRLYLNVVYLLCILIINMKSRY
jgi:hypothetical protein